MHQSNHKGRSSHVLYSSPLFILEKASANTDNKVSRNRNTGRCIHLFHLSKCMPKAASSRKRDKIRVRNSATNRLDCAAVEER